MNYSKLILQKKFLKPLSRWTKNIIGYHYYTLLFSLWLNLELRSQAITLLCSYFTALKNFAVSLSEKVKVRLVSAAFETFKRNILPFRHKPEAASKNHGCRLHIFHSRNAHFSRRSSADAVPLMQSGGQAGRVGAAAARWRTAPTKAELMRRTLIETRYIILLHVSAYVFQLNARGTAFCVRHKIRSLCARYR